MVLALHVWGPAFGLPSIEPECIATIAYCRRVIADGLWSLVADYDPTVRTTGSLPILFDDGIATATGFEDIVAYLRNHPEITEDIDGRLTDQQLNDKTAFTAFLQSTATPLIDLSLYVSAENYNTTTSSAYTAILPWYANYTVPPKRRELATARTVHMGLGSLDVDTTAEEAFAPGRGTSSSEFEAAKRAAGIPTDDHPNPPLHIGRRHGLGGLLRTPVYATRFRLDALANELLQPMADLLGKKDYLLQGEKLSSLDCLAFGYLSLLLYPTVPQAWLRDTIQTRFPRILSYIHKMRGELFANEEIDPSSIWQICTGSTSRSTWVLLPWQARAHTLTSGVMSGAREILGNIPLIASFAQRNRVTRSEPTTVTKRTESELLAPTLTNTLLSATATVGIALASLALYHRRSLRDGPLIFWASQPSNTGFGEAHNMLSILANQLPNRSGAYSQF